MFGYVTVCEPELKMKDYRKYKAYYCGLCRKLKEKYGFLGQITLTYDMTFAIILLTSLYECKTKYEEHICKAHLVKKQSILFNEITDYAADMNLLLAYYHMQDDWNDERKVTSFAGEKLLKNKISAVEKKYKRQCKVIKEELANLSMLESENCANIDYVAGCFGKLMEELFVYREDIWAPTLRKLGFYLGKFIYIMDAYDDIEKDIKENNYNPLKSIYNKPDYENQCVMMLKMMMAETARQFEKLPCIIDEDILRNIIYDGVWIRYRDKNKEKTREKTKDKNKDKRIEDFR